MGNDKLFLRIKYQSQVLLYIKLELLALDYELFSRLTRMTQTPKEKFYVPMTSS